MLKKHFWKIVALVVIVLLGASIIYSKQSAEHANEGVTAEAHIKGNPDSSVVLVEYSDFQCPACGQFYPYVKEIVEEQQDNLRFEYRHFPLINLHPHAVAAAHAAEAAGQQGKFWEMHDKLFENQSTWSRASNPSVYFIQYAEDLDLDMDLFRRHLDSSVLADAVSADFTEARELGFTGTPTFMLNGEEMTFDTFAEFQGQIEAAIRAADSE